MPSLPFHLYPLASRVVGLGDFSSCVLVPSHYLRGCWETSAVAAVVSWLLDHSSGAYAWAIPSLSLLPGNGHRYIIVIKERVNKANSLPQYPRNFHNYVIKFIMAKNRKNMDSNVKYKLWNYKTFRKTVKHKTLKLLETDWVLLGKSSETRTRWRVRRLATKSMLYKKVKMTNWTSSQWKTFVLQNTLWREWEDQLQNRRKYLWTCICKGFVSRLLYKFWTFNSRENKQSRQKMSKRHCNWLNNGPQRQQVLIFWIC